MQDSIFIITVLADVLSPNSARPSAGTLADYKVTYELFQVSLVIMTISNP